MAVNELRPQIETADCFKSGPAKENKPFAVVLVVVPVFPVELGTVVILRLMNEVNGNLVTGQRAAEERTRNRLAADLNLEALAGFLNLAPGIQCLPESGQHQGHIMPEIRKLSR